VWALHGALLASIERILRELDIQERLRERERSGMPSRATLLREQSAERLRAASTQMTAATRQVAEVTRSATRRRRLPLVRRIRRD
jgi:hypothetical protein